MLLSGELNQILIFGVVFLIFKVMNLFLSYRINFLVQYHLVLEFGSCLSFYWNYLFKFVCFVMARRGYPIPLEVQGMNDYDLNLEIENLRRMVELL